MGLSVEIIMDEVMFIVSMLCVSMFGRLIDVVMLLW